MTLPLLISLLLVLISHLALTLVTVHESQQAEHLCCMDEVKMAAYVGMGAAPLLALLLFLVDIKAFSSPLVLTVLLASIIRSLISIHTLIKRILLGRLSFPVPQSGRQKKEVRLFGMIAASPGSRLVVLCIGCGLVMVLPLYATVISVMINLNHALDHPASLQFADQVAWRLYWTQGSTSSGVIFASIILLTIIYQFYLNLGRWFKNRRLQ